MLPLFRAELKVSYIQSKLLLRQFLPLHLIVKLENSFDLRVQKFSALRCVEPRWNLTQSGACHVTYNVTFRDATGANLFNISGYNITRMRNCDASMYNSVNDVQLKVSFKNKTKIVTIKVHGTYSNSEIYMK